MEIVMAWKILVTLTSAAVVLMATNVAPVAAKELKISGAAAVAGNIIMPNKAAIEKETGPPPFFFLA
jgi:hypothetical protein